MLYYCWHSCTTFKMLTRCRLGCLCATENLNRKFVSWLYLNRGTTVNCWLCTTRFLVLILYFDNLLYVLCWQSVLVEYVLCTTVTFLRRYTHTQLHIADATNYCRSNNILHSCRIIAGNYPLLFANVQPAVTYGQRLQFPRAQWYSFLYSGIVS